MRGLEILFLVFVGTVLLYVFSNSWGWSQEVKRLVIFGITVLTMIGTVIGVVIYGIHI
ncbi:hypothetical protein [Bacillus toyonensis]|uniref:hypothetical protein n=1 Tax=Bacillus toyonensis TaxID=155322 RepID=UPI0015D4EA42|nr:hypothetical protein [Bacillus toyonensis]